MEGLSWRYDPAHALHAQCRFGGMRAQAYLDWRNFQESTGPMFQFSRRLALVFGIALPILETIRRFRQIGDFLAWPMWLDDFLLGAALLIGARMTSQLRYHNARYLAAAWGAACGMGYYSFFMQLQHLDMPDPAPISSAWVAAIKGAGLALAIVALIGALKQSHQTDELIQHPERLDEMLDSTDDA
jgi:hypothetical protein